MYPYTHAYGPSNVNVELDTDVAFREVALPYSSGPDDHQLEHVLLRPQRESPPIAAGLVDGALSL
jgi:hypothetical protein